MLLSHSPRYKTKYNSEKLVEVYAEGIGGNGITTFTKALKLPLTLLSTNTKYCNVVQVSYELKVVAEISGCQRNFKIRIPITIGNVPLGSMPSLVGDQQAFMPFNPPMPGMMPSAPALISDSRKFQ